MRPSEADTPRVTLARSARVEGMTLFNDGRASLVIEPAPAGHGLSIVRTDVPGELALPCSISNVLPETRRTLLAFDPSRKPGADNPSAQTVEHVLSALAGLGVTDALLRLHGAEMPMGDGSATPFVDAVIAAGMLECATPATPEPVSTGPAKHFKIVRVTEPIVIADPKGGWRIEAQPSDEPGMHVEYVLEYPAGSGIESQRAGFFLPLVVTPSDRDRYVAEIAPARTFSLLAEAQAARAMGMFKHLEPKDTLVIGPSGPIDNAYRFPNEPARHKLLDVIGDLSLVGRPIQGRVIATRSGHAQNHELARRLARL